MTSCSNKSESADGSGAQLGALVVVVLVAVVEVLVPRVGRAGLLNVVRSTSPGRRLSPISLATALGPACLLAAVSVVRMAVAS